MSIPDIFETHGEPHFRDGEARVIARLLDGGPGVLATGGGAFMREETREPIRAKAISIWLKADADVIMRRVKRRADRPLLQTEDPAATVGRLIGSASRSIGGPISRSGRAMCRTKRSSMNASMPCTPGFAARRDRNAGSADGHHAMTAPLKHSDSITVDVALGERAYDIVIGRDVLQSLGARIAALRPGARTAIVTDRNVAKHWLEQDRSLAGRGRHCDFAHHCR